MASETDAIRRVLSALQESVIEYMIVGSYAAALHGFVRTTHDLDLVVCLLPEHVSTLATSLGDEFYLDTESALTAIERGDMFNAIDTNSGIKVDFWMLKDDEFARMQFSRRRRIDFEGIPAYIQSSEDTVLSKLLRYRITPSDRQLSDVRGIIEVQQDRLDWDYLRGWARRKGVDDLLESLLPG